MSSLGDTIQQRLEQAFKPSSLILEDDGHLHAGHAGSANGGRHFTLRIQADCFKGCSRVEAHRQIYNVLSDLMPHPLHALRIFVNH